jgi:hypothetical protein
MDHILTQLFQRDELADYGATTECQFREVVEGGKEASDEM